MEKNIKNDITKMQKLSSRMPKTINEAMDFGQEMYEDDDELMNGDDEMTNEPEKHDSESKMDVMEFVDDIRKKSLRGMAQLADNPDDERYQLLKKIWQICDKKPEQQTAFSNPSQKQGMIQGNNQQMRSEI